MSVYKYYIFIVNMGFPCGSAGKESSYNEGDLGSILGLGSSMDCTVHWVAKRHD